MLSQGSGSGTDSRLCRNNGCVNLLGAPVTWGPRHRLLARARAGWLNSPSVGLAFFYKRPSAKNVL
jgi:hypothetical protein